MLWVGQQKKDLDIGLEGKKLNQRDSFVYLGRAVCGDRHGGGNLQQNTSWYKCMKESGRDDGR